MDIFGCTGIVELVSATLEKLDSELLALAIAGLTVLAAEGGPVFILLVVVVGVGVAAGAGGV